MAKQSLKSKPKQGQPLHQYIALGGNPKNYKGALENAVVNKKKK
jgi:hypothetical protein